jgi:TolB protein
VANGAIAFAMLSGSGWQIFTINPDGAGLTKLTDLATDQIQPTWSPDGARIAFVAQGEGGRMQIEVMNADGSNLQTLTEGRGWNYLPDWSPDGTRIAFVSSRDGNNEIYVMNADGSGQMRLTDDPNEDLSPSWSPDGTRIAFQTNRDSNNEIYVMASDGTNQMMLTDSKASFDGDPAWSPDGSRIAFVSDRDGQASLYVMNADGTGVTLLARGTGYGERSWSPDGSRIAFDQGGSPGNIGGIYVVDVETRSVTKPFEGPVGELCCPAWQPLPAAAPTPSPIEAEGRVTATIPISAFPNSVLVADGSVWVSGGLETAGQGDLVRLDPTTGDVLARIPMQGLPSWEVGGGGMTAELGSIWVLGNDQRGTILQRVDPASNRLVDVIPMLPDTNDADVWVDETGIWVLMFSRHDPGLQVVVVDPSSYEIGKTIPITATWAHWIFGAGGSIWVLGNAPNSKGPIEIDTLYRIDPSTGTVTTVTLPGYAWKPVVAGDTVWLEAGDDHVVELDATSGTLGHPIQVRLVCCSGPFVGDGAGGIWVASVYDGHDATFSHVSAVGTGDAEGAIPPDQVQDWSGVDSAFDPVTGSLWVVHYRDSMSRIEISDSTDGMPYGGIATSTIGRKYARNPGRSPFQARCSYEPCSLSMGSDIQLLASENVEL